MAYRMCCREQYEHMSPGVRHSFRVMVHCDPAMPELEFVESFGALQV